MNKSLVTPQYTPNHNDAKNSKNIRGLKENKCSIQFWNNLRGTATNGSAISTLNTPLPPETNAIE
jgi:hypothetical protein